MLRRALVPLIAAALCASCTPTIPKAALRPTPPAPPPAAEVDVCLLLAETSERPLAMGIDAWTLETWHLGIASILVRHPSGAAVIDPAFGSQIERDTERAPVWFRAAVMGNPSHKARVADQLEAVGVDPKDVRFALISHAHWDHTGGLRDLFRAKVVLSREELGFIRGLKRDTEHGSLKWLLDLRQERFAPFAWDGPPYEGFEASHDVFGDGTIVAVPLPGHTPGSVGYFINTKQKRWLYVGDAAWTLESIRRPVHKSAAARALADKDVEQTGATLGVLHQFMTTRPDVTVVPAHELSALKTLPACAPATAAGGAPTGQPTGGHQSVGRSVEGSAGSR